LKDHSCKVHYFVVIVAQFLSAFLQRQMKTTDPEKNFIGRLTGGLACFLFSACSLIFNQAFSQLSFSVNSLSGNYIITCAEPVITLSASSNYSAPVSYTWASSQGLTVANSLTVTGLAVYTITAGSGTMATSMILSVGVNTVAPSLTITANNSAFTCIHYSVLLNGISSPSNVSYQWITPSPGWDPTGAICPVYTPGTYSCIITDPNNGCKTTATLSLGDNRIYPVVSAAALFSIACPAGTVSLNTSVTGSGNNLLYTWVNTTGTVASGSQLSTLVVGVPGYYQVLVTDTLNGCTSSAPISVYACVGLGDPDPLGSLKIFPNPVKDKLYLEFLGVKHTHLQIKLMNAIGHTIFSSDRFESDQAIDYSTFEDGIYFLSVENESAQKIFRIVKY
jgi:hypothetical protein